MGYFRMSAPSNLPPSPPEGFFDDDYSVLMIGARRKAAPPIGAPAVNRHLGFWVPDDLALKRDTWIVEIENFIVAFYRGLEARGIHPTSPDVQSKTGEERLYLIHNSYPTKKNRGQRTPLIRDNIQLADNKDQPTRHHSFSVSFAWQFMPVDVRLELIDEYFTISISIDLSRLIAVASSAQEKSSAFMLQNAIKQFNGVAASRYKATEKNEAEAADPVPEDELPDSYREIFYTDMGNTAR